LVGAPIRPVGLKAQIALNAIEAPEHIIVGMIAIETLLLWVQPPKGFVDCSGINGQLIVPAVKLKRGSKKFHPTHAGTCTGRRKSF